jgi:Na+-translocating ferredoxin:NAD+ oxidoreductase RNF subunit RnfB
MDGFFCPVGGNPVMAKVAEALGRAVEEKAPMVAVMRCSGSLANRARTNVYDGYSSCKVMASLYAGDTGCKFGCLGKGDCEAACKFDAIHVENNLAVVDHEKCKKCGMCVVKCPTGAIQDLLHSSEQLEKIKTSLKAMEAKEAEKKKQAALAAAEAKKKAATEAAKA